MNDFNVGDLLKYDDGSYKGIAVVKSKKPNGFEAEVHWITTEYPENHKARNGFTNNIFSYKFLHDTTFWNKL